MTRRTHGARAVVTGAGSGIGRAFALELSRRAGSIVCADIDLASARATAADIETGGGRALAVRCNVSREPQVRKLAAQAADWFEAPPSLVINNAGIGSGGGPVGRTSLDDWRRTLDVNLWGVINGCHVFVPILRQQGSGGLINVASVASFAAAPRMAAYNVSKAGVLSLTETLAAELAGSGVRVTALCPTFVRTAIFDGELIDPGAAALSRRLGKLIGFSPERVARMALSGHDRGRLYVLPQPDARAVWQLKRTLPRTFSKLGGLAGRFAPLLDTPTPPPVIPLESGEPVAHDQTSTRGAL